MLLVGAVLNGYTVVATDGRVGTVSDVLFDDVTWKVRWLVVDTGTWLAGRKVLIPPQAIGQADEALRKLPATLTKAKVAESRDIPLHQPVSRRMQCDLNKYYRWDTYPGDGAAGSPKPSSNFMGMPASEAAEMPIRSHEGDPHLRSIAAVTGYSVHASDGEIGHVEDVLVDDAGWNIRYLVIDAGIWLPGKHVLLSPYAVREIASATRDVILDVNRGRIRSSPPWNAKDALDEAYEKRLHDHYDWPGYGW